MAFSKKQIDAVWDKAKKIRGKDPTLYRKDPYGNAMNYNSYGKSSKMGWEVDHIKPSARGGSDAIRNLQALNTGMNRSKGASLVKKSRHSK
ncbi:MAG: HNH endonuclease [Planctomycetes bacterium]|nr:HNH endonuclease [Planctomycetota bacterium]